MAFEDEILLRGFPERYLVSDPDVIYEVCPLNRVHNTDAGRDRDFGVQAGVAFRSLALEQLLHHLGHIRAGPRGDAPVQFLLRQRYP